MLTTVRDACELHPMALEYAMSEQIEHLSQLLDEHERDAGAFFEKNYVTQGTRERITEVQRTIAKAVDQDITELGIEHDENGNRAKAYLWCLETRCPRTGWLVPMATSWIISRNYRVCAKLLPDRENRRFEIEIITDASPEELSAAVRGTVDDGVLVYELDGEVHRTPIPTIRGDYRLPDCTSVMSL